MYAAKTFNIPPLQGISAKTIEEHLGLYQGYVKHVNLIHDELKRLHETGEHNYALAEIQRRLGFEFDGMKNHEAYFAQFEGGAKDLTESKFKLLLEKQFGSLAAFIKRMSAIASTRGVGWAMSYFDHTDDRIVCTWVDEQHLGQLADVKIILALDMWEHSYMLDYPPSQKKDYIEAFFANLNWEVIAVRV